MRKHGLLAPSRVGSPRGPRTHDGTLIPDRVDEMWGTDLTATWTGQGQAAVFVTVDHRSAECVGIHAAARATRFEALGTGRRKPTCTCRPGLVRIRVTHASQSATGSPSKDVIRSPGCKPAFAAGPPGTSLPTTASSRGRQSSKPSPL